MSFAPTVAALVSLLTTTAMLRSKLASVIQDVPNARSLHSKTVPRIGGLGLMAGILSGWVLVAAMPVWWLILPVAGVFVVSLLDDRYSLPVRGRLFAHLLAAAILVVGAGLHSQYGGVVALAALLFTVWMTNLYNFMDGSDGLAGGMALFGFAAYGAGAWIAHNDTLTLLNLSISAAALGFLYHNFPPARVFMGDAGSIPLGFLAAAMGLWGWQQGCWSAWFPLLVFSPFIVDASVTLIRRSLRGVKITEAHREHYYQRAVQLGWSHRKVALIEYFLMLSVAASALLVMQQAFPWRAILAWGVIYAGLMAALDLRWNRVQERSPQ
jgi:UDP-N-acetylmuramyl pentapeptide phosphotransferase/UDP-N-acetylglucosamine-1-phosphate transferase